MNNHNVSKSRAAGNRPAVGGGTQELMAIADLIAASGLANLPADASADMQEAVLRDLRAGLEGADPVRIAAVRTVANERGISPALLAAAFPQLACAAAARVVCMADVEPEAVSWLWWPYLPRRKITLLEGDPGDGKTFIALTLSAALTRGNALPGEGEKREPLRVLYWTAEDGLADTLRPRLDAAGADPSRVFALDPETPTGDFLTLDAFGAIEGALDKVRPALLVIDPLQAALGAKVDAHRANETRPHMTRLRLWAERYECAVLVIRHLSKASTSKAVHRGLGSIDFAAAARSILLVGRDPENEGRRAVVQTKSSLGPHGPALDFEIKSDGRLHWLAGPSKLTAAALLAPERSDEDRSAEEDAQAFLEEVLHDGELEAEEVKKQARKAGVSERTLYRAKRALGVDSKKQTGKHGRWIWHLSTMPHSNGGNVGNVSTSAAGVGDPQDCQGCQSAELGGGHPFGDFRDLVAVGAEEGAGE